MVQDYSSSTHGHDHHILCYRLLQATVPYIALSVGGPVATKKLLQVLIMLAPPSPNRLTQIVKFNQKSESFRYITDISQCLYGMTGKKTAIL